MSALNIDDDLYASLRDIREAVRALFEQLRLRNENGDVSGKERLERVPALSKRNFSNLSSEDGALAAREAWRLVDFIEGSANAKLTTVAREALRLTELDRQLAALRSSTAWKRTSARLREVLSSIGESPNSYQTRECEQSDTDQLPDENLSPLGSWFAPKVRVARFAILVGAAAGSAAVWLWFREISRPDRSNPALACLALERASEAELAAHWRVGQPASVEHVVKKSSRPIEVVISDPPTPGTINSIYTTSVFSMDGDDKPGGPGGGRADARLMVGGWGDTYLSLVKVPLVSDRPVSRAILRLTVLDDALNNGTARPTSMTLRVAYQGWDVMPGGKYRLWWHDCPNSRAVRRNLPPAGPSGSPYDIDITDQYNDWVKGHIPNFGIILEPNEIGKYGEYITGHSNFNVFFSTRAVEINNRPKIIVYY